MSSWQATLPFNPVSTPRPNFKSIKNKGVITYYPSWYTEYEEQVRDYLHESDLYNDDFYETIKSQYGVLAEVRFYIQIPKNQAQVGRLLRTTAPDIDNLLKALFDSIFFKELGIRDSRICGVNALKFNEKEYPRTDIKLVGIEK